MQRFTLLFRYFNYYFSAQTRRNIQSPFVSEFAEIVLDDDRWFYAFSSIEILRKLLLRDTSKIKVTDYGAGSQMDANRVRTVRSIAQYSATTPFFCRVLFRLINHYKPKTLLEMGTSLGISTLYQAAASLNGQFITLEGCPNISVLASKNFERLEAKNIKLITGSFQETLPVALEKLQRLDYVFIDGDHRKEPTLDYFEQCLQYSHEQSVFVFDDIHWSDEMESAWEKIKQHSAVTLTIDLFFCGVVFIHKNNNKQKHFTLAPAKWKPWSR